MKRRKILLLIIFLAAFTITGCQANQNDNSDNDVQEIDENEAEDPLLNNIRLNKNIQSV